MSQISDEELLTKVYAAAEDLYVPYSGFPIGAALLLNDGMVVTGCSVENASYRLTNCAERTVVLRMVAERGDNHEIAACAIAGQKTAPCHPYGACRQVLHEFGCKCVIVGSERPTDDDLGAPTSIDFEKILPYAFGPEDLQTPSHSRP